MKALIFYKRDKKPDKLTKARFEMSGGAVKHFEPLGWVRSPKGLDIRGLRLFSMGPKSPLKRIQKPVSGSLVLVYYIEK